MAVSSDWPRYRSLSVSNFENIHPMESLQLAPRLLSRAAGGWGELFHFHPRFDADAAVLGIYKNVEWISNLSSCPIQACQSYSAWRCHGAVGTSPWDGHPGLPDPGRCSCLRKQKVTNLRFISNLTHLPQRHLESDFSKLFLLCSKENKSHGFPLLKLLRWTLKRLNRRI